MVKKVKKFNYSKNLKKAWQKKKAKKNPQVNTDQLKAFWDPKKTLLENYKCLGIAADPNKSLEIPKARQLQNPEFMSIAEAKKLNEPKEEVDTPALRRLIKDSQQPVEKKYDLNENDQLYCIYMMEKYGEDYDKMARDYKNYYQDTACQIKKKITLFKRNKTQYQKYLQSKKAGVNFLDQMEEKY